VNKETSDAFPTLQREYSQPLRREVSAPLIKEDSVTLYESKLLGNSPKAQKEMQLS